MKKIRDIRDIVTLFYLKERGGQTPTTKNEKAKPVTRSAVAGSQ
jgi:hypothetical protein